MQYSSDTAIEVWKASFISPVFSGIYVVLALLLFFFSERDSEEEILTVVSSVLNTPPLQSRDVRASEVQPETPSTSAGSHETPESSGVVTRPPPAEFSDILGDIEIPDGFDPSFLAALPEDMRQEVINDRLRSGLSVNV